MNKIKNWTYLCKEVIKKFSDWGLKDILIINKKGKIVKQIDHQIIFFIEPNIDYNFEMYNKLFQKNWYYIFCAKHNDEIICGKKYIHILNIGDSYKIYIMLKKKITSVKLKYITDYISVVISDDVIINRVIEIKEAFYMLDEILNLGKDIYAIPGNIFDYKCYFANFAIKQGAMPICGIYDVEYILLQKNYKRI